MHVQTIPKSPPKIIVQVAQKDVTFFLPAEQSHERSESPTIMSVMNIPTNWRRWRLLRGRSIEQSHERSE